jgi:hypothetical protein
MQTYWHYSLEQCNNVFASPTKNIKLVIGGIKVFSYDALVINNLIWASIFFLHFKSMVKRLKFQ